MWRKSWIAQGSSGRRVRRVTSLLLETIISIVSSPVPGVHIMRSRAQTKVSRKKARKWRKRETFPSTSFLPGFFSSLQLFCPTLPYLNALSRLTFQSMMINRAYFILLIFLAGHMKPTMSTTCQRENCEFFFSWRITAALNQWIKPMYKQRVWQLWKTFTG